MFQSLFLYIFCGDWELSLMALTLMLDFQISFKTSGLLLGQTSRTFLYILTFLC